RMLLPCRVFLRTLLRPFLQAHAVLLLFSGGCHAPLSQASDIRPLARHYQRHSLRASALFLYLNHSWRGLLQGIISNWHHYKGLDAQRSEGSSGAGCGRFAEASARNQAEISASSASWDGSSAMRIAAKPSVSISAAMAAERQ